MSTAAARAVRLVALGERRAAAGPLRLLPHPRPLHSYARRAAAEPHPRSRRQGAAVRWSSQQAGETKKYSFDDLKSRLSSPSSRPLVVIDVREPKELQQTGSIPGARNLPVSTLPSHLFLPPDEFEDALGWPKPREGDEVVFFCRSGVRSRAAAAMVADEWGRRGVAVCEYPGSWMDWEKQGGEVEKV